MYADLACAARFARSAAGSSRFGSTSSSNRWSNARRAGAVFVAPRACIVWAASRARRTLCSGVTVSSLSIRRLTVKHNGETVAA